MARPSKSSAVSNDTGPETQILINGKPYDVFFTWHSFAEMYSKHGISPDFMNPLILAEVIALGLRENNPEVTQEVIVKARPPMAAAIKAVRAGIEDVLYGSNVPDEVKESVPA